MDRAPNGGVREVPSDQDQHPFLNILERDGFTYRLCGSHRNLEVYHIRCRSRGGDDSDSNLLTLCHGCHADVHALKVRL